MGEEIWVEYPKCALATTQKSFKQQSHWSINKQCANRKLTSIQFDERHEMLRYNRFHAKITNQMEAINLSTIKCALSLIECLFYSYQAVNRGFIIDWKLTDAVHKIHMANWKKSDRTNDYYFWCIKRVRFIIPHAIHWWLFLIWLQGKRKFIFCFGVCFFLGRYVKSTFRPLISEWKRWPSQFNQLYYINQSLTHVHHLERCHEFRFRIRTLHKCAVYGFFCYSF